MKKLFHLLICLFILILSQKAFAINDTLVKFGQNISAAPQWKYKGGGTNLDGVSWKILSYPEPGWLAGTSAFGFGGGPAENTILPQDNSAGGAGPTNGRYPTIYFRKIVNISNLSAITNFLIRAKFDDGIVVWINGNEAYRNNVGTGTVSYNTWANSAISNNGNDIYTAIINKTMFITGANTIAVELHQSAASSSDLFFDFELIAMDGTANVTRGPYLQMGNKTSITLKWKTDVATNSRVEWGPNFGNYTNFVDSGTVSTDHTVTISGLNPDTKYFYTIGSSGSVQQEQANNWFRTLPDDNSYRKLRFAAFGDCGNNSTNQVNTKNALLSYIGTNELDGLLTIGDNAYSSGTDTEFQNGFFNVYQNDILRYMKLYPTTGNHDYGNSSANTGVRNNAYYNNFILPTAGEIGGEPSGTEAYYSYNIGNVHFLSLDSYGRENSNTTKMYDTTGAQALWVKADLAANTKKWVVVYFHHPPYTKTSHTSDTESDLIAIRENFIRILERYGVDLILCGHAHGYERSYLLQNYYKANAAAPTILDAQFRKNLHTADSSSARYDGTALSCAYNYNSGKYNHGSVYIVSGSAGQLGGSTAGYPHDAMYYSDISNGGSFYFEVDSNRLDAKFISYTGTGTSVVPNIRDQFTIFKDVNKVTNIIVGQNQPLDISASWRGTYNWPNNGNATSRSVQPSTATVGTYNYIVTDANSCLKDSFNVQVSTVLPVLLKDFNATLQKDKVLLTWSTLQQVNSQYFTIEKSIDGINYSQFANVNAAGNASTLQQYSLVDNQPYESVNYYRLSQTSINGQKQNLGVKKVTYLNGKELALTVLYNGGGKITTVINSKSKGNGSIKVMDVTGREVFIKTVFVPVGSSTQSLQLRNGIYVLQVSNGKQQVSQKLIIE